MLQIRFSVYTLGVSPSNKQTKYIQFSSNIPESHFQVSFFRSQSRKLVFLSVLTLCLTQPPIPGNLIFVHSLSFHIPSPPPPLSPSGLLFYICDVKSGNEWNLTWKRKKKCFLRKAKWVYIINSWEWKGKRERKKKAGRGKRKEGRKKRGCEARGMELGSWGYVELEGLGLVVGGRKLQWQENKELLLCTGRPLMF